LNIWISHDSINTFMFKRFENIVYLWFDSGEGRGR